MTLIDPVRTIHCDLKSLVEKYARLLEIRRLTEVTEPRTIQALMAELAARFPGSLRELDDASHTHLQKRLEELQAVQLRGGVPPLWARLISCYHGLIRAGLRVRRFYRERPLASLEDLREAYQPQADEPDAHRLNAEHVTTICHPPRGRLSRWALTELAEAFRRDLEEVELIMFPRSRNRTLR